VPGTFKLQRKTIDILRGRVECWGTVN